MGKIKIYEFRKLESTNSKAKDTNYDENEYVIYTKKQTDGRGQYDRKWNSITGLTFSIVLKSEFADAFYIFPQAIVNYLSKLGIQAIVKEPNDIFYNEKKLGGILIETLYNESVFDKTIIGIGLNINESKKIMQIEQDSITIKLDAKPEEIINGIWEEILSISDNRF
jgi:biotin-[acetyl-CoA-carboxylase] ligase BirA-like protein